MKNNVFFSEPQNGFIMVSENMPDGSSKAIAVIDTWSFRSVYINDFNPLSSPDVFQLIDKKIAELKASSRCWFEMSDANKLPSLHIKTKNGEMTAEAETSELTGADYDAIYTGITFSDDPFVYADLVAANSRDEGINLYVFDNIWDEDWQDKRHIDRKEIKDLIDSCKETEEEAV